MNRHDLVHRLVATFLVELEEHARSLERDLLSFERATGEERATLLVTMFRAAHSLKGAARAVDATVIAKACHQMEGVLSRARDGTEELGADLVQVLLGAADALREAGARMAAGHDLAGSSLAELTRQLEGMAPPAPAEPRSDATEWPDRGRPDDGPAPRARPAHPTPPAQPPPPTTSGAAPADPGTAPHLDTMVRVPASKLDLLLASSTDLLVVRSRAAARQDAFEDAREQARRLRRLWQALEGMASEPRSAPPGRRRGPSGAAALGPARRGLERLEVALDRLEAAFRADHHQIAQAAARLEEQVRRVRMLPLALACEGLERAVRDAAQATGKDVTLQLRGGDVELDRAVLEGLGDPLLHLVRNAVVHGAEGPEVRATRGKPRRATVTVDARLHGDHVDVEVADDGAGLDVAAVQRRAAALGLPIPADAAEAARTILAPGFTTALHVTEHAGRGVGLDVVQHRVEGLRGSLAVTTTPGAGVRVRMTVPLTLATVRALLVGVGTHTFAIPAESVERLVRLGQEDLHRAAGQTMARLGDLLVPVAPLGRILDTTADPQPSRWPAVILAVGGRRLAVEVDTLLGVQEVVVRALGPRLRNLRPYAGATLLASGRIALILSATDVVSLGLAASSAAPPAPRQRPRRRILVVDDAMTTRGLMRSILEAAGYDVLVACDGAEAWERLQSTGADLVVADVEMPRMDGFELTEVIRASARLRSTPVVLVTALESDADRARGLAAGADAWLTKRTFDQRELLATIVQLT